MTLTKTWDTLRTTLEEFDLPPYLVKSLRWMERHPRTVLAGAVLIMMAVALTQTPSEQPVAHEPYGDETPLFV